MKTKYTIYLAILVFPFLIFSQEKELKKGNLNYEVFAFTKAIDIYERVAEKGHVSADLYQKLGNSYYFNADLNNAKKWYEKLIDLNEEIEPEYYFRYSHTLKSVGEYKEADIVMGKFHKLTNLSDKRGNLFANTPNYLQSIKAQSGRYDIENLDINSEYSDFAPSFYKSELIFSSARDTGSMSKNKHKWDDKYFLDLYAGKISENGHVSDLNKFSKKVNTKFHESTSVFTQDGNTAYFTRNNYRNGKTGENSEGIINLKIYRATKNEYGNWNKIEELPFNNDEYSVAHPTLSPDETLLYFSSDKPGGYGLSDIYEVKIRIDGTFGTPKNLGKEINTEGRETFPFISKKNDLYFASDGRPGLGGLDIYVTSLSTDIISETIYNLGKPINSSADDFSYIINSHTNKGYFASNRNGGKGSDDIYSLIQKTPLITKCANSIKGIVFDKQTNEVIANSKVVLINRDNEKVNTVYTDSLGQYDFTANCNFTHFIRATKENYSTNEVKVDNDIEYTNLKLDKNLVTATLGDDLSIVLDLNPIYFSLDKSTIRKDAKIELEKIVVAMKKYPNIKIDVRSHTDSRANDDYNMKLSNRRAKATINYIVKQGINRLRLTGKGYGETQLKNDCVNNSNCSEKEHQKNRRSEFIILPN